MTKENLVTVPVGTNLDKAEETLHKHRIEKLLVVDKKGNLQGLITIKDINKRIKFPNACKDPGGRLRVGAAVSVSKETEERAEALAAAGVDVVVVDTAHGHSQGVLNTVKTIRKKFPKLVLIAGNVVTAEAVKALVDAGADCVKVGVGPGSICTTRVVTGVGVPQVWAIAECAKVAKKNKIGIIADGGIKYSGRYHQGHRGRCGRGHAGRAFCRVARNRRARSSTFRGACLRSTTAWARLAAMQKGRSADRYFQDNSADAKKLVPEGIEARVPYRGQLTDLVFQLVGGLRAGMGYSGTPSILDLQANGRFVQITHAGYQESHPHDVVITKEAPNYYID